MRKPLILHVVPKSVVSIQKNTFFFYLGFYFEISHRKAGLRDAPSFSGVVSAPHITGGAEELSIAQSM